MIFQQYVSALLLKTHFEVTSNCHEVADPGCGFQIRESLNAQEVTVQDAYGDGRHVRYICFAYL